MPYYHGYLLRRRNRSLDERLAEVEKNRRSDLARLSSGHVSPEVQKARDEKMLRELAQDKYALDCLKIIANL